MGKSKENILDENLGSSSTRFPEQFKACARIAMDEFAKQEAIEAINWAFADEINPFMFHDGKFIQACGNSTSWTTEQLYNLYLQSKKQKA